MNLQNIAFHSKTEFFSKLLEKNNEFDFYLKYYRKSHRLLKLIDMISIKSYIFKHIPYVGFKTAKHEAIKLIDFYNDKTNSLAKDLRKTKIIRDSLDISPTIYSIDTLIQTQELDYWNINLIGAYYAQKYATGKNIKVGIIDTGIDYNHKYLKSNFTKNKGYDFVDDSKDPFDYEGHGTHVTGIVAASEFGVAPDVTLYSLRVLDKNGSGDEYDIIRALDWALDNSLDVINMSLGAQYGSSALEDICRVAQNKMYLVAAAGNSGSKTYLYPASFDSVISVSAVDENKQRAQFSTYNDKVDISAPGVRVLSCLPYDETGVLSGTSMATPHVTGVLALLLSYKRNNYIEELVKVSAEPLIDSFIPDRYAFGYGLIRADRAINLMRTKGDKHAIKQFNKYYKKHKIYHI